MLHLRRYGYSWADHRRQMGDAFYICFCICAIALFVSAFTMAMIQGENNDTYDSVISARHNLVKVVDGGDTPVERRSNARLFVNLAQAQHLSFVDDAAQTKEQRAQLVDSLKEVAKTGQRMQLPKLAPFNGWYTYLLVWVPLALSADLLLLMALVFLVYAVKTDSYDEYLMDFEWKRIWPVFFVIFTSIPIGLPFYLVSWVRVRKAKRRQTQVRPYEEMEDDGYDVYDTLTTHPVTQPDTRSIREQFASDPDAARQLYVTMRSENWKSGHAQLKAQLRAQKTNMENAMRDLGERLRQAQSEKNRAAAELRELESIDVESAVSDNVHADAEFDRLLKLPGITGVRREGDDICLLLEARYRLDQTLYDLGDWELRLGPGPYYLNLRRLRSGVRPGWSGGYPNYGGENSFCFGPRYSTTTANMQKGQFLEGIELAVNCMQSINERDIPKVPDAFMPAAESEEL